MGDEGPTTVGSIVGKLKMDRDQWSRDKQATIADARELGDLDPTITVSTNAGEALAQMDALHAASGDTSSVNTVSTVSSTVSTGSTGNSDAVAAAENRVTAARVAARLAAQAEELAALRLDAAETARGRTDVSVAAAELALARATNATAEASAKAYAAGDALVKVRQEAAFATYEDAEAEDELAKKTDTAGATMSRFQKQFAAVIALGPGLIPIAGFAAGAGAAVSAMAGVAVLAVLGIRNELKSGSADAQAFSDGLSSLKTDVSELEATAAKGILGGFQSVVSQVKADMPELNSETKMYSQILGAIAGTGFGGLLSSFHALSPLILDVDQYLLDSTTRLSAFADSPGMRKFVTYAQQTLPTVEQLLNSLVTVAFHLLAAFAPWGSVVVDVLQGVVNVVNAIPTHVLSNLIELALGGSLAFKAWSSIPAMFMSLATTIGATAVAESGATVATGALGAAIDFMEGPIGWVIAGLGALVAVFVASAAASSTAATATNSYTAALAQDNGVIGDNVKLQAAKNLQDSGALDNAKKLGISSGTLVAASLGSASAMKTVNGVLDTQQKKLDDVTNGTDKQTGGALRMTAGQKDLGNEIDSVRSSIETQNASLKSSKSAYDDLQVASGALAGTNQQQADAFGRLADEETAATNAGKLWKTQLDILNGASQTLEGANIALAGDYQSMTTTITNNIKQMGAAQARSLALNTAGGLANHQLVLQAVTDAETQSQAIISAEGNTAKAREDGRQALIKSRQSIIDHMVALGLDRDAVTKLVDAELSIPAHPTSTITIYTTAATKALNDLLTLESQLNRYSGSQSQAQNRTSLTVPGHAAGGTVTGVGSGTSDSNIRALSVGEEVTRASSAAEYRPMLKAINSGNRSQVDAAAQAMGIGGSGGTAPSTTAPITAKVVNKSGYSPIGDLIELHIQQHGMWQQIHLDSGGHN